MNNETININLSVEPSQQFKYVWAVLSQEKIMLMSWGIQSNTIKQIPDGTSFFVNGFKHQGEVQVTIDYSSDSFTVKLMDSDGSVKASKRWIYLGELVNAIDELVEKTEDYEERVKSEYGIA